MNTQKKTRYMHERSSTACFEQEGKDKRGKINARPNLRAAHVRCKHTTGHTRTAGTTMNEKHNPLPACLCCRSVSGRASSESLSFISASPPTAQLRFTSPCDRRDRCDRQNNSSQTSIGTQEQQSLVCGGARLVELVPCVMVTW